MCTANYEDKVRLKGSVRKQILSPREEKLFTHQIAGFMLTSSSLETELQRVFLNQSAGGF